jgi:hypothetical protein
VLTIRRAGHARTISTKRWQKPPVRITGGEHVDTFNCIHEVDRIPGSTQLLVELAHSCNASGDWCTAGGPTWELVDGGGTPP